MEGNECVVNRENLEQADEVHEVGSRSKWRVSVLETVRLQAGCGVPSRAVAANDG